LERASGAGAESATEAETEKESVFVVGIGINRYLHQKTKKPGENETGSEIEKRNLHRKTTMGIFFAASRKWSPRRYAQENDYGPMHRKTTMGQFCAIRQNI
jgi:biotin-(acetyl-CoA carboxylase) ligase